MADVTREQLVMWMLATGKGYTNAAKHFGVKLTTARSWRAWGVREGMLPVGRPPTKPTVQDHGLPRAAVPGGGHVEVAPRRDGPTADAPGVPAMSGDLSTLPPIEQHREIVAQLRHALLVAQARQSSSAVASIVKQLQDALAELNRLVAEAGAGAALEDLDEQEFAWHLRQNVRSWPEDYFAIVFEEYEELRRVKIERRPILEVVGTGVAPRG